MTAASFNFFKAPVAAPRVVLLPDHRFFVRAVPVADGATGAEVAGQIELALENLSPFPPAQLYHGYYWTPGAAHALVFAAYRKRFAADETAEWGEAQMVVPAFVAAFGVQHEPATTVIYPSADGLTAVHWGDSAVPANVIVRQLAPEATEAERAQVREEMLRTFGGSRAVVDLPAPPEPAATEDEKTFFFRTGEVTSELPVAIAASLDVRDKGDLGALRSARRRDLVFWRVFAGCAAALILLFLGEILLLGGRQIWFKSMAAQIAVQRPVVEKIETAHDLATHIDRLSSERLLPFEMIEAAQLVDKMGSIYFTRTTTTGRYSLLINGQTTNSADLDVYRLALQDSPAISEVRIDRNESRNGLTTFVWEITFKPDALHAAH